MAHSAKAQREELRRELIGANCSVPQIAAEMARRFNVRPRVAWRYALGWTQWKVTQEFRVHNPDQSIGQNRVSEWESWPHGGSQPSLQSLVGLAMTFGNGCTRSDLVDALDLAHFTTIDRSYFDLVESEVRDLRTDQRASGSAETADATDLAGAGSVLAVPWTMAGGMSLLASTPCSEGVGRRDFLALSAGTVVGIAHDWLTTEAPHVASAVGGGRIDGNLAASLEQRLPTLRHIDHTLGGLRARPLVNAELRLVNDVLTNSTYADPVGRRLFAVAAELCRIAGWASCDAGQHATAERYWVAGIRAAHLAGDHGIGANILKSMSLQRAEAGQPAQAIALAEAAREGVRDTADDRVLAMLTVRQARTHASRGDRSEAERLLGRAETHMERVGDDGQLAWASYFDDAEFHAQSGASYLLLGQYRVSDSLLERALAQQPDERSRDRATYTIWRAENALHLGDVERACAHATDAIPDLVGAVSTRNRTRLAGLRKKLCTHARNAAVRDLDAQLEGMLQVPV